ncbi:hypothetical protein [Nocardioides caldifontis]|uniref:hypothetical protein n=1 Tax=Nocardioides caldifontis TaxID=2588938 RepID=UPI0011DF4AE8|nr:hypothetical protein [Nocardioides caldifontis]
MARRDIVAGRVRALTAGFDRYLAVYDGRPAFRADQLAAHRQTIELRRRAGSAAAAASDPQFAASLYRTLRAWGLGMRASVLVPESAFAAALVGAIPVLTEVENLRIDDPNLPDHATDLVWALISGLGVTKNQAKIVAGTKTLHHLLPELVPPIDREWTGLFFGYQPPRFQSGQQHLFQHMFATFRDIALQVDLASGVSGQGWRTSTSKLLDNAVIGYCDSELRGPAVIAARDHSSPTSDVAIDDTSTVVLAESLTFRVDGHFPPAKNTATSMLAAAHPDATRVRALLAAAKAATSTHPEFAPIKDGPVALEVVLTPPTDREA